MDIKIGKLRVQLSALALYSHNDHPALGGYLRQKMLPRPIYHWNCTTQTGKPAQRLGVFEQETAFNTLVTDLFGTADKKASTELAARLSKGAGLADINAFDKMLQTQLKPLQVNIDWDRLWKPYKDQYSLVITAQVHYLQCVARPYGLNITDYFYVLVPQFVTFSTIVTGRCSGGTHANGTGLTGMSHMHAKNAVIETLEQQIMQEEREAEALNDRMKEHEEPNPFEWNPNPTHSDMLNEDEEPEPEEGD